MTFHEHFTLELDRAEAMIRSARVAYDAGNGISSVTARLRSAKRHILVAKAIAEQDICSRTPTSITSGTM